MHLESQSVGSSVLLLPAPPDAPAFSRASGYQPPPPRDKSGFMCMQLVGVCCFLGMLETSLCRRVVIVMRTCTKCVVRCSPVPRDVMWQGRTHGHSRETAVL